MIIHIDINFVCRVVEPKFDRDHFVVVINNFSDCTSDNQSLK